jgi:hypothetical protein
MYRSLRTLYGVDSTNFAQNQIIFLEILTNLYMGISTKSLIPTLHSMQPYVF